MTAGQKVQVTAGQTFKCRMGASRIFVPDILLNYVFDRFAEEKWRSRFDKVSKENYLEMGLLSFSVVYYTQKNGQQAMEVYVARV